MSAGERSLTVALVGDPNTGKSTFFNAWTGLRQTTGNWPGVTVEKLLGQTALRDGTPVTVVDLPGMYSLHAVSEDERVASEYARGGEPDLIVNVVDLREHLGEEIVVRVTDNARGTRYEDYAFVNLDGIRTIQNSQEMADALQEREDQLALLQQEAEGAGGAVGDLNAHLVECIHEFVIVDIRHLDLEVIEIHEAVVAVGALSGAQRRYQHHRHQNGGDDDGECFGLHFISPRTDCASEIIKGAYRRPIFSLRIRTNMFRASIPMVFHNR